MKVNEIFYSLQGEGRHVGTPAVFIRLAGCNLHCDFCDTDFVRSVEMTETEILAQVQEYPARLVILTGGEPLLQVNARLTFLLHQAGYAIHMETNGTRPLPSEVEIDWITCSPKPNTKLQLQQIQELKVIYWGQDVTEWENFPVEVLSLQPLDSGDPARNLKLRQLTIEYILRHPVWRLSLQQHKILDIK